MKYYVRDGNLSKQFDTIPQVVRFLEELVKIKFGKTRAQWMDDLVSLGHGYDDDKGQTFTNTLAEHVEIGVVRGDRLLRATIHDVDNHNRPEFGN